MQSVCRRPRSPSRSTTSRASARRGAGIRSIARKLDYQSPKASAQPATSSESICLLHIARHGHTVNRDHDVFIADYIEGLGQGSKQVGLSLEVATFKRTPIEQIIAMAQQQPAAGLIVLGTELSAADVEAFSSVRKPLVFLDTYHEFLPFDFVDMNNEDSVFTVSPTCRRAGTGTSGW